MGKSEVLSLEVGNLTLAKLKALDGLSYLLFASIYRDFNTVADFAREINALLAKKSTAN